LPQVPSQSDVIALRDLLGHPDERVAVAAAQAIQRYDAQPLLCSETMDAQTWSALCEAYVFANKQVIEDGYQSMNDTRSEGLRHSIASRLGISSAVGESRLAPLRDGPAWWSPLIAELVRPLTSFEMDDDDFPISYHHDLIAEELRALEDVIPSVLASTDGRIWDHHAWHSWGARHWPATEGVLFGMLRMNAELTQIATLIRRTHWSPQLVLEHVAQWAQLSENPSHHVWIPFRLLKSMEPGELATTPPLRIPAAWRQLAPSVHEESCSPRETSGTRPTGQPEPTREPGGVPVEELQVPVSPMGDLPHGGPGTRISVSPSIDARASAASVILSVLEGQQAGLSEWLIAQCHTPSPMPIEVTGMKMDQWFTVIAHLSSRVSTCEEWVRVIAAARDIPNIWGTLSFGGEEEIGEELVSAILSEPMPVTAGRLTPQQCRPLLTSRQQEVREIGIALLGRVTRAAREEVAENAQQSGPPKSTSARRRDPV